MAQTNERDSYNAKPHVFDGEKFDYWKDRIESFFLGYDADLWDIVTDGYKPPVTNAGVEVPRSKMSDDQKREFKIITKPERYFSMPYPIMSMKKSPTGKQLKIYLTP